MDAVSYLLGRNKRPAHHFGLGGLLAGGLSGLLLSGMISVGNMDRGFGVLVIVVLAMIVIAAVLGCLIAGPFLAIQGVHATFKGWNTNRLLDEFTSTGLNERKLVNSVTFFYWKSFILISAPMALALTLLTGATRPGTWYALAAYLLLGSALIVGAGAMACWEIAGGWKGLLALGLLFASSLLGCLFMGVMEATLAWDRPGSWQLSFTSLLYMLCLTWLGRRASTGALERRSNFDAFVHKWSEKFALKRRGGSPTSDNAVLAREQMLGSKWSSLAVFGAMGFVGCGCFLGSLSSRDDSEALWGLAVLAAVSFGQAAFRLSQVVSNEHQRSTLETLRSTPFGAQRFMRGWLRAVIPPLLIQNAVLATPIFLLPFGYLNGQHSNLGTLVCVWTLTMLAPVAGAFLGISICAQVQPLSAFRQQLGISFLVFFGVLSMELGWLTTTRTETQDGLYLAAFNLFSTGLLTLALFAGSQRSLIRFFQPQE